MDARIWWHFGPSRLPPACRANGLSALGRLQAVTCLVTKDKKADHQGEPAKGAKHRNDGIIWGRRADG